MRTFTIYHIPGYKVGATADYRRRSQANFRKYGVEPYIIEEHTGLPNTPETWQIVGDLEWEYADEFGYDRGEHYVEIRRKNRLITTEQRVVNAIAGGRGNSKEEMSRKGKLGCKIKKAIAGSRGGKLSKGYSKEQRKCPHCDMVSNPGAISTHIRFKH